MSLPRILITPGEPAGIGPDVVIYAAQYKWQAELVAICDPHLLQSRSQLIHCPLQLIECDIHSPPQENPVGTLKYIPEPLISPVKIGRLDKENADYVMRTLLVAANLCMKQYAQGVVTGPVNKEVINSAGIAFSGHTEFFAHIASVSQTVMLFVVNEAPLLTKPLLVALASTHMPLSAVPSYIDQQKLTTVISVLIQGLQKDFGLSNPHILVCGINPHAGEGGYLGKEEIETIKPVITTLKQQGLSIEGPFSSDTIFTPKYLKKADAILAMYHDQALPVVKFASFGHAVNVTLGLPFIRTSVDHGTAIDIAGSDKVDAESMRLAIDLAIKLTSKFP